MDTKEINAIINNVLVYEDKNTPGLMKSRMGYFVNGTDSVQNTEKFKGISELSLFTSNDKLFNSINVSHIGKPCKLRFEERMNPRNPLKSLILLKEVVFKDETISVL